MPRVHSFSRAVNVRLTPRNERPAEVRKRLAVTVKPGVCPDCGSEDRFIYRDPDGSAEVVCPDCILDITLGNSAA